MTGLAQALAPLQSVLQGLDEMMPDNWQGQGLRYSAMVPVMQEGFPLAWVPPASVIRELLAADGTQARAEVLERCRVEILASCRTALSGVGDSSFAAQTALLEECVRMAEHGMFGGAQALAANVWDTFLRGLVRANPDWLNGRGHWPGYRKVLTKLPAMDDEATIGQFRDAAPFLPFTAVLREFWGGNAVPLYFNRHATAHGAGAVQYTPANAVTAIMLAVSVLREIDDCGYQVRINA